MLSSAPFFVERAPAGPARRPACSPPTSSTSFTRALALTLCRNVQGRRIWSSSEQKDFFVVVTATLRLWQPPRDSPTNTSLCIPSHPGARAVRVCLARWASHCILCGRPRAVSYLLVLLVQKSPLPNRTASLRILRRTVPSPSFLRGKQSKEPAQLCYPLAVQVQ